MASQSQAELVNDFILQCRSELNVPLVLQATQIVSGPHAGKTFIEIVGTGFRFLDLSAELRNRIYELVLTRNEPVNLSVYNGKLWDVRRGKARHTVTKVVSSDNFLSREYHPRQDWDKENAKWIGGPLSPLSILSVNKQIHKEATTIAYGTNCFRQTSGTALIRFFHTIGPSLKHVTEIDAGSHWTVGNVKEVTSLLQHASSLRTIWFRDDVLYTDLRRAAKGSEDPKKWAVVLALRLKTLLMGLQTEYIWAGRTWKVLDVVKVRVFRRFEYGRVKCLDNKRIVEVFMRKFRSEANEYLQEE